MSTHPPLLTEDMVIPNDLRSIQELKDPQHSRISILCKPSAPFEVMRISDSFFRSYENIIGLVSDSYISLVHLE